MEKWIVFGDSHIPFEDKRTLKAIEKYIADEKWDGWLHLGDLLDFNEISRWLVGKPRKMKFKLKEYYSLGTSFLDRHRKLVGPKCKMVLLQGNHCFRIEDWLDQFPFFEGMVEVAEGLGLSERKIQWIKSWEDGKIFRKGKALFVHGKFINQYHANKMGLRFGTCVYYGHTHDVQEISQEMLGDDKTIVGKSMGCTCAYNQKYLKGAPTKWQQSFTVFYFFPDGHFTEQTIRIFKHRFVAPNGKVYEG